MISKDEVLRQAKEYFESNDISSGKLLTLKMRLENDSIAASSDSGETIDLDNDIRSSSIAWYIYYAMSNDIPIIFDKWVRGNKHNLKIIYQAKYDEKLYNRTLRRYLSYKPVEVDLKPYQIDITGLDFSDMAKYIAIKVLAKGCPVLNYDGWNSVTKKVMELSRMDDLSGFYTITIKTKQDRILVSDGNTGFVYVILSEHSPDSRFYKIGLTKNIQARLANLSASTPFELKLIHAIPTNDMRRTELELHNKFSDKRQSGEWFSLDDADLDYIKSIHLVSWK